MNMKSPGLAGDLKAVLLITFLTLLLVFVPGLNTSPVRVVFGLPFVLFLPGYALIAALFPRKDDLDGIERVALSFGLSIAVVPLIGLVLNYTPFGIRLVPIAVSLSIFIFIMTVAAGIRRNSLRERDRFSVHFDFKNAIKFEFESPLDKLLTILLITSILAAIFALGYVIITPKTGERFTEFYILGSGGKAANYPTDLIFGRPANVRVGIVNQEYEPLNYTLTVVLENSTLYRGSVSLGHNSTWEGDVPIVPAMTGEDLKLEFLLFKNSSEVPYRTLHLWVDVR